jgi:hypothetical protein
VHAHGRPCPRLCSDRLLEHEFQETSLLLLLFAGQSAAGGLGLLGHGHSIRLVSAATRQSPMEYRVRPSGPAGPGNC